MDSISIKNDEDNQDFLELTVVAEKLQKIEQIEELCKTEKGEKAVTARTRQLGYARLLVNLYHKSPFFLVQAHTELGIAYLDMKYNEQALEHLLAAYKLNGPISSSTNNNNEDIDKLRQYHIKILVKLADCYLQKGDTEKALKISNKTLEENKKIYNEHHISNVDIYYIIANSYTKLEKYEESIKTFKIIYDIYEKYYGYDSDKIAKICLEMAQVYEAWNLLYDSIEYYMNSYTIWDKIIKDNNYEIMFVIALKVAGLYGLLNDNEKAYNILNNTENKYGDFVERNGKKKYKYQKEKIKYSMKGDSLEVVLKENLKLEEILRENDENRKALAKTCVTIGYIYLEMKEKKMCIDYLKKAQDVFELNRDKASVEDIAKRINEIELDEKENDSERDESFNKINEEEK